MTKFRKALLFTLCLIPFAAVGGWFTAQMSIASVDEEALANAIQQVGSKEMVMLLTTLQTVIYAVICGFLGYIVADKIGLIRPFQLAKKDTLITLLAGAICGIIVSADAFTFANWMVFTISRFSAIVIMIFLSWAEFSKTLTTVLKFSTEICNSVVN